MHVTFRSLALCAAAAVTLTGCGKKGEPDAAATSGTSTASTAKAASATPRAGHWDVKVQMVDLDVPGMPKQLKDTVAQQISQAGAVATCLTPEEAARNDGKFFQPKNNKDCTADSFAMEGGKLNARMTCAKGGAKQAVEMHGTYSAEAYDLALDSKGEANGQPMKMSMRVTGRRTGECTGKERG